MLSNILEITHYPFLFNFYSSWHLLVVKQNNEYRNKINSKPSKERVSFLEGKVEVLINQVNERIRELKNEISRFYKCDEQKRLQFKKRDT